MPRSFLIKNKKQHEKHEKTPPPEGEGHAEEGRATDSPGLSSVAARDARSHSPGPGRVGVPDPVPCTDSVMEDEEEEYLDVESIDTEDEYTIKFDCRGGLRADLVQQAVRSPSCESPLTEDAAARSEPGSSCRSSPGAQPGRSRPSSPCTPPDAGRWSSSPGTPSTPPEYQSQPEDLSRKRQRTASHSAMLQQTSPLSGLVPVMREWPRGKSSPESGLVLRVPGKRAVGTPGEYLSPPSARLGASPPERANLGMKCSDPRFWMAGLPGGVPPYLPPGMAPLFAAMPGQFPMLPPGMDSPLPVSAHPGLSAFRMTQEVLSPFPYPTSMQGGGGSRLTGRPTYMPFQNPFLTYPIRHTHAQSTPRPGLNSPRPVSSHGTLPAEPDRPRPSTRPAPGPGSPPLNWLLDTPYNLSTKPSAAHTNHGLSEKSLPPPPPPVTSASVTKRPAEPPRYQCEACSKSYATFSGLSKHKQFHCESQVKKEFNCKFCEKTYTSLGALKMHIRTHTLPCKCQICGKAFSRPWLLQGHVRTHTGEKPFTCQHCGRAFADRSNLRAHLQTHSDVKKYSCKTCSKTFSRMSLLLKHQDGSCPGLRPGLPQIAVA